MLASEELQESKADKRLSGGGGGRPIDVFWCVYHSAAVLVQAHLNDGKVC